MGCLRIFSSFKLLKLCKLAIRTGLSLTIVKEVVTEKLFAKKQFLDFRSSYVRNYYLDEVRCTLCKRIDCARNV